MSSLPAFAQLDRPLGVEDEAAGDLSGGGADAGGETAPTARAFSRSA